MDMKGILINSLKYAFSNWFKIILLGLVIFLADISNELYFIDGIADELRALVIFAGSVLAIYQLGFIFRIIEETTQGHDKMPQFDRIINTFAHGLKEALVTVIYFIIPFIIILIGVVLLDDITGPKAQEIDVVIIFSGLFLGSLTYLLYQAVVLNMANYHGTIRSAFDFKRIFRKLLAIGFKKLAFIYFLTVVFAALVEINLSDVRSVLPYGLGDLISSFIIAPFILIFIARILGLINRDLEN